MKFFILAVLALTLVGCGITAAQREELIKASVKEAGELAERLARDAMERAITKTLEEAKKIGATDEELAKLEQTIRKDMEEGIIIARQEAENRAFNEANKRLPKSSGKGGGWLGDLLLLLAPIVLNLGASYVGKRFGLKEIPS